MFRTNAFPSLVLITMGLMDCVTTVVGILYYGAVELNPILTGVVNANLTAFIALKLTSTVFVALIFRQAGKILMQNNRNNNRSFAWNHNILRIAYAGAALFMLVVVVNNVLVLARAI
ncbi:MAG TPA: DUF5658 family protein [Candidatus Bathyarchaeia archaeon]|nr:DUF5658 family protein [Candidatus Bathyarchaeia archaeon]